MRATQRMTGFAKKTVERALREIGENCRRICDEKMVNLPCRQIQCDEIWAFVGCKQKNAKSTEHMLKQWGDIWTWVAIDRDTKLIPAWFVGDRTANSAYGFMRNLQPRLANPAQICTSHVERQNLTMRMSMRMSMRRFTRLTNGFSKTVESHKNALALHFAHYNFCRIHSTLRVTPAMECKLTDHVWELEELLAQPQKVEVAA
jgi:IS1 family transposase